MFEKWATQFADTIKKANPDETEPHDVLVFGFTILFNLFFTFFVLLILGWILSVPFLTIQVFLSFIILRILTGGSHLDQSLACSITSILLILLFVLLPTSPILIGIYSILTILLLWRYAPYYEPHQIIHSQEWERKKKRLAILWVVVCIVFYYLFGLTGFVLGALLQAVLLIPASISSIHKLNTIFDKGGEKFEKDS